ncbi:MAG TPA: hypothetical protein VLA33_05630 [Gemmatimonadota bacterium]|nr:hypothetical protein [Gemmatimonadota bacterium]
MQRTKRGAWGAVQEALRQSGLDFELPDLSDVNPSECKVVCVPLRLGDSLREMGKEARDQVVMVRVDDDTKQSLDAWVATGALKSRSEAAALFIREGLKVRAQELQELEGALRDLRRARDQLEQKARDILRNKPKEGKKGD